VPGAIVFALFGAAGQALYNRADARHSEQNLASVDAEKTWYNSKWSPVKVLSDKEYETILQEKLLRVEAELAILVENLEALRKEASDVQGKSNPLRQSARKS
jgi:hypothetical protein